MKKFQWAIASDLLLQNVAVVNDKIILETRNVNCKVIIELFIKSVILMSYAR